MAVSAARRLGVEPAAVHTIRFLVLNHLAMIQTGLKRDLDNPQEIERFAGLVGNLENLKLLTLLTVSDTRGTSQTLWNGFKNTMLSKLYARTAAHLSGESVSDRADKSRRNRLAKTVRENVSDRVGPDEVQAHFQHLPTRYFLARSSKEIVADIELMHDFMVLQLTPRTKALHPVVAWHDLPDRGFTQVKICTWDHQGAFRQISGALTAADLTILSAEVFTREEGVLIDTFSVLDGLTGGLVKKGDREHCETLLQQILVERSDPMSHPEMSSGKKRRSGADAIPTRIRFINDSSSNRTIIEVEAEDRLGLVHTISGVLADLGLDLSVAKIATEKGAAWDTFYVREASKEKVLEVKRQKEITRKLKRAIDKLPV